MNCPGAPILLVGPLVPVVKTWAQTNVPRKSGVRASWDLTAGRGISMILVCLRLLSEPVPRLDRDQDAAVGSHFNLQAQLGQ